MGMEEKCKVYCRGLQLLEQAGLKEFYEQLWFPEHAMEEAQLIALTLMTTTSLGICNFKLMETLL